MAINNTLSQNYFLLFSHCENAKKVLGLIVHIAIKRKNAMKHDQSKDLGLFITAEHLEGEFALKGKEKSIPLVYRKDKKITIQLRINLYNLEQEVHNLEAL